MDAVETYESTLYRRAYEAALEELNGGGGDTAKMHPALREADEKGHAEGHSWGRLFGFLLAAVEMLQEAIVEGEEGETSDKTPFHALDSSAERSADSADVNFRLQVQRLADEMALLRQNCCEGAIQTSESDRKSLLFRVKRVAQFVNSPLRGVPKEAWKSYSLASVEDFSW